VNNPGEYPCLLLRRNLFNKNMLRIVWLEMRFVTQVTEAERGEANSHDLAKIRLWPRADLPVRGLMV
jgi:hypothetical protein